MDAAYVYNCRLLQRSPGRVVVSLPGDGRVEYEVLHVLPFDSVRKRMSILVRDPVSGERKLFCKGADSNMLPRLSRAQTQVQGPEKTNNFSGVAQDFFVWGGGALGQRQNPVSRP